MAYTQIKDVKVAFKDSEFGQNFWKMLYPDPYIMNTDPQPKGQILSPWQADVVDYTAVVPARQVTWAGGPVRQSYAIVDYIPQ
jgi:hypothetical protein